METPEQWEARRAAAEARYAAKMPDDKRREYFLMVKKARGVEAANRLIDDTNIERRMINAELSGPRPLAAEGSRSNDVLERGGKGD